MKVNLFKLSKTIFKTIIEYLGMIGICYTFDSIFRNNVKQDNILLIENLLIKAIMIFLFIYMLIKIGRIINIFIHEKTSYSREFLKKSHIGYEVGSFWDVVKRFEKEEELAIVIGVNNRFSLDKDYINNRSLIYDYIGQFDENAREEIEKRISQNLKDNIVDTDASGSPIYSYGSIYVVPPTDNVKYEAALLSMCEPSKFNVSKRFASERRFLIQSLESLFEQMPGIFTNATLIIPLIGTSSSGSPLSHEEVAKYLISAFANYSRINDGRLAKRLIISLYDKDIEKEYINLEDIKQHIDMECISKDFSYSKLRIQVDTN